MEILFIIYIVTVLSLSWGSLLFIFLKNKKLLDIELDKPNFIYKESLASKVGRLKTSYPLSKIRVYNDLLVIRGYKSISLKPDEIESISLNKEIIGRSIIIIHSKSGINRKINLWSANIDYLFELLDKAFRQNTG
ncbi:MAG: hypothetical protein Q9M91_03760 [Candidatus Dojkabacteria bacterium]|nr:hypothetical protein [Candidatus Dojkabacteria bacterium]MDQ7020929.1 hypothetical protein [Candidatus Dojkabacteria bacterium]